MTVNVTIETVHIITYILLVLGVISWSLWARKYKTQRLYAVAPLSFLLHVLVFYVVQNTNLLETADINLWSAIIRLHGVLLVTVLAIVLHGNGGRMLWTRS